MAATDSTSASAGAMKFDSGFAFSHADRAASRSPGSISDLASFWSAPARSVFAISRTLAANCISSIVYFMGIPFGDGCVDFHRTPAGIPTNTAGVL